MNSRIVSLFVFLSVFFVSAQAQTAVQTSGTLVIVAAEGDTTLPNDQAHATFMIEEQDREKAVAASRVNQKMKQGIELLKREDPQARLKSYGYFTYPVYADEQNRPAGKTRPVTGWRVGQYLEMKTNNLASLPKTVAGAQKILALNGLQFGLSEAALKKIDEQRIDAAYRNLSARIAAVARAMGRKAGDAMLETVDFEASGAYTEPPSVHAMKANKTAMLSEPMPVEEPNFEPGETTLQMRVVGKVRFK